MRAEGAAAPWVQWSKASRALLSPTLFLHATNGISSLPEIISIAESFTFNRFLFNRTEKYVEGPHIFDAPQVPVPTTVLPITSSKIAVVFVPPPSMPSTTADEPGMLAHCRRCLQSSVYFLCRQPV